MPVIIKKRFILRTSILLGILGTCAAQSSTTNTVHANPISFCQLLTNELGQFSYRDGGALLNGQLPSQYMKEEVSHIEISDKFALNTNITVLRPSIAQAGTNCSTDLYGTGINPGATTIDSDPANFGVKAGSNARGYSSEYSNQLAPVGIHISANTGIGYTEDFE